MSGGPGHVCAGRLLQPSGQRHGGARGGGGAAGDGGDDGDDDDDDDDDDVLLPGDDREPVCGAGAA